MILTYLRPDAALRPVGGPAPENTEGCAAPSTPPATRPIPAPPAGFDPRAASGLELRRYGLPRRPDPAVRPDLAGRWDAVFSRPLRYITPEFTPVPELVPGIERRPRLRPGIERRARLQAAKKVTHPT